MKKNLLVLLVLVLCTSGIIFMVFRPVLSHPNGFLFSAGGDAVKSYYNFSYYLKYDKGIKHDGFNYPYGEHLLYDNTHPLHVLILKFIDKNLYPVSDQGIGILNLSMILSLLIAVPFIFLILRHYSLPRWYAFACSVIILFLSPQIGRIGGHFEMVYAFFIPLFWYLLILRQEDKRKTLWTLLIILAGLTGAFTSAYYAAIYTVFILSYWLVEVWNHRQNLSTYIKEGLSLLFIAIIPVVTVKTVVFFTDWASDRPDNPWGFFIFHSNLYSIFLPQWSAFQELAGKLLKIKIEWEGRAYVGLPATVYALFIVFSIAYFLTDRKNFKFAWIFPNRKLNSFLAASFLALLFAMCIPFKWGFAFLLDLIPPLKQFRALGRFSWIFYYVFTIAAAWYGYYIFRVFRVKGFKLPAAALIFFLLVTWSFDAGFNLKKSTGRIFNKNTVLAKNDQDYDKMLEMNGLKASDYQAILFLPFTNTCGDKLLFSRGTEMYNEGAQCSYRTGIPMIQSLAPRISFRDALSTIQLLSDSCIEKSRIHDMNEKNILLIYNKESLSESEKKLVRNSTPLFYKGKNGFASLPVEFFRSDHQYWLHRADSLVKTLSQAERFFTDADTSEIFYRNFDTCVSEQSFTGSGALYKKKGNLIVFEHVFSPSLSSGPFEISFWLYIDHRTDNMPEAYLNAIIPGKDPDKLMKLETREVYNVAGKWARIKAAFVPKPGTKYQLVLNGKYITVDDLLIKPAGTHVYIKNPGGQGFFDNFPLNTD